MIYTVLISIENLEVTFEENEGMYCKVTEVSVRWGGGVVVSSTFFLRQKPVHIKKGQFYGHILLK